MVYITEIPSNNTGKYKKHGEWAFPSLYPTIVN